MAAEAQRKAGAAPAGGKAAKAVGISLGQFHPSGGVAGGVDDPEWLAKKAARREKEAIMRVEQAPP